MYDGEPTIMTLSIVGPKVVYASDIETDS
ncbi:MAG: hypothetical protein FD167_6220, partial [bacterium]